MEKRLEMYPFSISATIKKREINNHSVTYRQYPYQLLNGMLGILFPLVTYPYLTRVLGPERLGAIHFVDYAIGLIYGITSLGIPAYGVYRIAHLHATGQRKRPSYLQMLGIHTVLSAIGFGLFYVLFSDHEHWNYIKPLLPLGACYLIANIITTDWYLQGRENFKSIAFRNLLLRSVGIFFLFFYIQTASDYIKYYWIVVIGVIGSAIYNLLWIRKDLIREKPDVKAVNINPKELFLFFIATVFISITDYLDATMLGILSDEAEVGFYTNASKLVRLSLLVTLALNVVVFPQFASIHTEEKQSRSLELLSQSIDWLIFLTIPISFLYLLFGQELVWVFSGSAFFNSISAVYWMAPIPLFISLSNLLLYYGLSSRPDLQKRIALGVAIGITISIGLNMLLIPMYGAKGAAMNSCITEGLFLLYFVYLIRPAIHFSAVSKAALSCLLFLPVYGLVSIAEWVPLVKLLIGGIACVLLYILSQHFIWKHRFVAELPYMLGLKKQEPKIER